MIPDPMLPECLDPNIGTVDWVLYIKAQATAPAATSLKLVEQPLVRVSSAL